MKFESVLISSHPKSYLIKIKTELNSYNSLLLDDLLLHITEDNADFVLIDLQFIERISSNAIKAIFLTSSTLKRKNGNLILFNLKPRILKMLEMVDLINVFTIAESERDAMDLIEKS